MKQAIALAGGGTKGAYQVGAWKAMRELGIPFDIVTGTSIGSVTAALMVQGDFDRAWELWTHITEEQIMLEREGLGGPQPPYGGHHALPCARAPISRRGALFRLAGGFRTHDGALPVVPAGRGAQA